MHHDYIQATRVAKKLRPGQPGAKRAHQQYGQALVCIRHRHDPMKLYRITTVELVVSHAPIHPRRFDLATFGIETTKDEYELRKALKAAGARWDHQQRLWWLRGSKIRKLGLVDRITTT